MLCSISTGKSGTNWLDRLRLSKGFPAGDDLDLEQFLNCHNPNLSISTDTNTSDSITANVDPKSNSNPTESNGGTVLHQKRTTEIPRENGQKEWFGIMSHVLAELFNMEDSNDFPRINEKKSSRKQPNPKICLVSTSVNVDDARTDDARRGEVVLPTLPSIGYSSRADTKEASDQMKPREQEQDVNVGPVDVEEEEKSHADLSAFSRTEVTVIDTSCPSWKLEKLLLRRKNVWKVRDKKWKGTIIGSKKRKASPLDEIVSEDKKPKLSVVQCSSSKEANGEECKMPPNEGHHGRDKTAESCKEMLDILSQVPKKRFPRKLKKGGSSVVLIKNIPSSKKNGEGIPKSSLKPTQRQYKAA